MSRSNERDRGGMLDDRRWRWALYILAVIGSIDLVQLIVLFVVLFVQ